MTRYILGTLALGVSICGTALAGDPAPTGDQPPAPEVVTIDVQKDAMEVLERVPPTYPRGADLYGPEPIECKATVTVSASGSTAEVAVSGCEEPFQRATKTALEQWKYKPQEKDGGRVQARFDTTMTFEMKSTADPELKPKQIARILADHEEMGENFDHCVVKASIYNDGTTGELRTSQGPRCMVMDSAWTKYPKKLYAEQDGNVRCTATFEALAGEAGDVTFGECPEDYQKYAEKMIGKWLWQTQGDKAVKYEARLVFEPKGPPARGGN